MNLKLRHIFTMMNVYVQWFILLPEKRNEKKMGRKVEPNATTIRENMKTNLQAKRMSKLTKNWNDWNEKYELKILKWTRKGNNVHSTCATLDRNYFPNTKWPTKKRAHNENGNACICNTRSQSYTHSNIQSQTFHHPLISYHFVVFFLCWLIRFYFALFCRRIFILF